MTSPKKSSQSLPMALVGNRWIVAAVLVNGPMHESDAIDAAVAERDQKLQAFKHLQGRHQSVAKMLNAPAPPQVSAPLKRAELTEQQYLFRVDLHTLVNMGLIDRTKTGVVRLTEVGHASMDYTEAMSGVCSIASRQRAAAAAEIPHTMAREMPLAALLANLSQKAADGQEPSFVREYDSDQPIARDGEADAGRRRTAFLRDLAAVCVRHRVLVDLDPGNPESDCLREHPDAAASPSGFAFTVDLSEFEAAVRDVVWPIVYGG